MGERTPDDVRLGSLMQAAQRGDTNAYLLLLQEITPRVRQIIVRRGPLAAREVEDLVQDVLLSVHVARASYDADRPYLPWLLAIVRNRLADGVRRYMRQAAYELPVPNLDVTFSDLATNSSTELLGDVHSLRRAVEALPPRQRTAVELLKLRGLSLKEAASATGMTVGALKVATHRALASLRRMLAGSETHGH